MYPTPQHVNREHTADNAALSRVRDYLNYGLNFYDTEVATTKGYTLTVEDLQRLVNMADQIGDSR